MSPEEKIRRAERAKALLESETFKEVVAELKAFTTDQWRASPAVAIQVREALFFEVHGLEGIEARLAQWIDQGAAEAKRIEKERERDERAAARWGRRSAG